MNNLEKKLTRKNLINKSDGMYEVLTRPQRKFDDSMINDLPYAVKANTGFQRDLDECWIKMSWNLCILDSRANRTDMTMALGFGWGRDSVQAPPASLSNKSRCFMS